MESLRYIWLSAFVGGAECQLCVPKSSSVLFNRPKNNGSSVEYERKNDNVRAKWTVLHQKCSPATPEGWPRACAQLRPWNRRIKSRELTASVVGRRGPVVIRT